MWCVSGGTSQNALYFDIHRLWSLVSLYKTQIWIREAIYPNFTTTPCLAMNIITILRRNFIYLSKRDITLSWISNKLCKLHTKRMQFIKLLIERADILRINLFHFSLKTCSWRLLPVSGFETLHIYIIRNVVKVVAADYTPLFEPPLPAMFIYARKWTHIAQ